jgi:hypothetical protein
MEVCMGFSSWFQYWIVFCGIVSMIAILTRDNSPVKNGCYILTGGIAGLFALYFCLDWLGAHYMREANAMIRFEDEVETRLQLIALGNILAYSLPLMSVGLGDWVGNKLRRTAGATTTS